VRTGAHEREAQRSEVPLGEPFIAQQPVSVWQLALAVVLGAVLCWQGVVPLISGWLNRRKAHREERSLSSNRMKGECK
jgi:hypothetical protein